MAKNDLHIGMAAPDFAAPSTNEKIVTLHDLRGSMVVLYFYPKDFTARCIQEACAFRDRTDTLSKLGATIFGVSKDSPEHHRQFRESHHLPFHLLSDAHFELAAAYGAKRWWGTARMTYVIDDTGVIRRIWPRVNVRRHAEEVCYFIQLVRGQEAHGLLRASLPSLAVPGCAT